MSDITVINRSNRDLIAPDLPFRMQTPVTISKTKYDELMAHPVIRAWFDSGLLQVSNTVAPRPVAPVVPRQFIKEEAPEAPVEEAPAVIDTETALAAIPEQTEGEYISILRAQYKSLSGKDADKRWKEKRLEDEIAKLEYDARGE